MSELIKRITRVAGQDFDSPECRVKNPRITARESIELADYIVALEAERDALAAQVVALKNELTLSTDQKDLLLDEFVRVKLLTDNEEIHGLCERAHVRMQQKVSVIDRNFKQAEEIKQLKSRLIS